MIDTKINPASTEWAKVKAYVADRVQAHRIELESLTITTDRAQQLRGMIHALQRQIEDMAPPAMDAIEEPNYG